MPKQNISTISTILRKRKLDCEKWKPYYETTKDRAPRPYLVDFLKQHNGEFSSCIELGCGAFADSAYIASQGVPILATNLNIPIEILQDIYKNGNTTINKNLTAQPQDFEHLNLPKADFIYSSYALSFCPQISYVNMITDIANSVNPEGYILLHFFREDHPFVKNGLTGFTPKQIKDTFEYLGFTGIKLSEWKDENTQNYEYTEDLNNILISAQAPKQLPEISRETLQQLLGIKTEQLPPETPMQSSQVITSENINGIMQNSIMRSIIRPKQKESKTTNEAFNYQNITTPLQQLLIEETPVAQEGLDEPTTLENIEQAETLETLPQQEDLNTTLPILNNERLKDSFEATPQQQDFEVPLDSFQSTPPKLDPNIIQPPTDDLGLEQ